jgi:hypothetical protein
MRRAQQYLNAGLDSWRAVELAGSVQVRLCTGVTAASRSLSVQCTSGRLDDLAFVNSFRALFNTFRVLPY